MSEGLPKPDGIDFVPPVDPNQVAQDAALENPQVTEGEPVLATEMQEDTQHDVSDQVVDDTAALDSETEARIQELRDRGRVGVLTEGTERRTIDYIGRMDNSEHDPDAIAAVNKANRLSQQQLAEHLVRQGRDDPRLRIGKNFEDATNWKLDEVAREVDPNNRRDRRSHDLKEYFEDPEGWETRLRERFKDNGKSDERIEEDIELRKGSLDSELERIGEKGDETREYWLQRDYERLKAKTSGQDQYRGDLLNLYARDPEKYKAMATEEFVAEGRKFRDDGQETSRLARLESFGKSLEQRLPEFVEDASSLADFCEEMSKIVSSLQRLRGRGDFHPEELFSFVEAIEGKEIPGEDTLPEDSKTPEQKEAVRAYNRGQKARQDTEYRLSYGRHGYFSADDFPLDLDRPPREQMREAVERIKSFTNNWITDGQKAREEFDKKWGKAPEDKEPNPKAA